jgi:hypothetical protein
MVVDSFFEDYINIMLSGCYSHDYNIWYIGIENSIGKGINELLANLEKHGHIIIGEPEMVDYIYEGLKNEILWVILYKSLPKLEYLEYKLKEKEDNNV